MGAHAQQKLCPTDALECKGAYTGRMNGGLVFELGGEEWHRDAEQIPPDVCSASCSSSSSSSSSSSNTRHEDADSFSSPSSSSASDTSSDAGLDAILSADEASPPLFSFPLVKTWPMKPIEEEADSCIREESDEEPEAALASGHPERVPTLDLHTAKVKKEPEPEYSPLRGSARGDRRGAERLQEIACHSLQFGQGSTIDSVNSSDVQKTVGRFYPLKAYEADAGQNSSMEEPNDLRVCRDDKMHKAVASQNSSLGEPYNERDAKMSQEVVYSDLLVRQGSTMAKADSPDVHKTVGCLFPLKAHKADADQNSSIDELKGLGDAEPSQEVAYSALLVGQESTIAKADSSYLHNTLGCLGPCDVRKADLGQKSSGEGPHDESRGVALDEDVSQTSGIEELDDEACTLSDEDESLNRQPLSAHGNNSFLGASKKHVKQIVTHNRTNILEESDDEESGGDGLVAQEHCFLRGLIPHRNGSSGAASRENRKGTNSSLGTSTRETSNFWEFTNVSLVTISRENSNFREGTGGIIGAGENTETPKPEITSEAAPRCIQERSAASPELARSWLEPLQVLSFCKQDPAHFHRH